MISKNRFNELKKQVEGAIDELLIHAETKSKNNDIIVFVSKSEYIIDNEDTNNSVWSVEYELERIQETGTTNFLLDYLNTNYRKIDDSISDTPHSIIIELMLYTHMWESTRHIKLLRRLAILCSGVSYEPYVSVPDNSRYKFIKEEIRDIFETEKLRIYQIFKQCYKSQFRNAFAHNDFSLSSDSILFNNYRPPNHPYRNLKFDEWTEVFILSALLKTTLNNKVEMFANKFKSGSKYDVELRHGSLKDKAIIEYNKTHKEFKGTLK